MRSLLSFIKAPALVLAGTLAFAGISYAQNEKSPNKSEVELRYINKRDVPVPDFFSLLNEKPMEDSIIYIHDADGDGEEDLRLLRHILSGFLDDQNRPIYVLDAPSLVLIDINKNKKYDDDEVFIIDYANSQPTNPLLEKSKGESPKTKILPQEFDGEKKLT